MPTQTTPPVVNILFFVWDHFDIYWGKPTSLWSVIVLSLWWRDKTYNQCSYFSTVSSQIGGEKTTKRNCVCWSPTFPFLHLADSRLFVSDKGKNLFWVKHGLVDHRKCMMDGTCTHTHLTKVDITLNRELAGWGQFNILSDWYGLLCSQTQILQCCCREKFRAVVQVWKWLLKGWKSVVLAVHVVFVAEAWYPTKLRSCFLKAHGNCLLLMKGFSEVKKM